LTREIEVGGERLAVTLDADGVTVRPVGARKHPHHLSWAACVCAVAGQAAAQDPPTPGELAEAIKALKAGASKDAKPHHSAPAHGAAPVPPTDASAPVSSGAPAPAPSEASVHALLSRIERWLAAHRSKFHRGLLAGAHAHDLDSLKAALGGHVPEELAELLRWHNGQSSEVTGGLEQSWGLMGATEIVEAKRTLDAHPPSGWRSGWVPFMDDDGGSYLALDTTHHGHPVVAVWKGKSEHHPVAKSLAAWLQDFAAALEAGKYHEDPERGTFLRSH
jgi:cell wall assembly regulator SMI1